MCIRDRVKIKHDDKHATAYLHLNKIAKNIRKGVRVDRGQYIGDVGSTGFATGPHLHYSFYIHGKYVDPLKVKLPSTFQHSDPIPGHYLKNQLRKLRSQHAQMKMAASDVLGSSGTA